MIPWILLDCAQVPGNGGELRLYKHGEDFSIKIAGRGELMNSRKHGSEKALAEMTCQRLKGCVNPRLLIGGLGMGFTLAAALHHVGEQGQVVVAELVPAVVKWNEGPLGLCAGQPLNDTRASVREGDVAEIIKAEQQVYDGIILDVDNGPEGITRKQNNWLYSVDGLKAAFVALRPNGVLAVWSAGPADDFYRRLTRVGSKVEQVRVRAHGKKGTWHTIWLARRETSK